MKLLSFLAASTVFALSIACNGSSVSPASSSGTFKDIQVSMFGFNGTFTGDGAVLLGRTFQMTATARFSNGGQDVTSAASWESSNPSVAPISSSGLLTGLAPGITIVTATYQGTSGTLPVMVSNTP